MTTLVQSLMLARVCEYIRQSGADCEAMLREVNLPADADQNPDAFYPLADVLRLRAAASDRLRDPHLGVRIASANPPQAYGIYYYLFQHSENLEAALTRTAGYFGLLRHDSSMHVQRNDQFLTVSIPQAQRSRGYNLWMQEVLTSLYIQAAAASPAAIPLHTLRLAGPPIDAEPFEQAFGVVPTFGNDHDALVWPAESADIPWENFDPNLTLYLDRVVQSQIATRLKEESSAAQALQLQGCLVDLARGVVIRGNETISLTTKEQAILQHLASRANQIVTRQELEQAVWSMGSQVLSQAAAVAIRRLRQKLEPSSSTKPVNLVTVFGKGWRLNTLQR